MLNFKLLGAAAFSAALLAGTAIVHATPVDLTITFDDDPYVSAPLFLDEDSPGVLPESKCNGSNSEKPCLKVNTQGAATLSINSPLTFTIKEFWFLLIGRGDDMLVTTYVGDMVKGTLSLIQGSGPGEYGFNDDGHIADVSGNDFFKNITKISFIMACPPDDDKKKKKDGPACAGTGLIDDIKLTYDDGKTPPPATVPLPAGGALLLAGLAGLGLLRRRKAA